MTIIDLQIEFMWKLLEPTQSFHVNWLMLESVV